MVLTSIVKINKYSNQTAINIPTTTNLLNIIFGPLPQIIFSMLNC